MTQNNQRPEPEIDRIISRIEVPKVEADRLVGPSQELMIPGNAATRLVQMAAPVPAELVQRWKASRLMDGLSKQDGFWAPEDESGWSRRCAKNPGLAYALWTAMRALGIDKLERGRGQLAVIEPGRPTGAVCRIDLRPLGRDQVIVFSLRPVQVAPGEILVRLRLGDRGQDEYLTPGPTLEDALLQLNASSFTPNPHGNLDDLLRNLDATVDDLIHLELRFARGWLEADRALGLVALCGPLSSDIAGTTTIWARQKSGYLDEKGLLTDDGWWRLAYLSGQGVGQIEQIRARWLSNMFDRLDARTARPMTDELTGEGLIDPGTGKPVPDMATAKLGKRRHLQMTQKLVMMLMEEGMIPLGVEISATHKLIGRYHRMKPDALMVRPPDTLVWVELLRRNERYLAKSSGRGHRQPGDRYRRMREKVLPWLAAILERPVELVVKEPNGIKRAVFEPGERRQLSLLEMMGSDEPPRPAAAPEPPVAPPSPLDAPVRPPVSDSDEDDEELDQLLG